MDIAEQDREMINGSLQILNALHKEMKALDSLEAKKPFSALDEQTRGLYAGKESQDTVLFDIIAENIIIHGKGGIDHPGLFERCFQTPGILITEERGRFPSDRHIFDNTPVMISDPVDGSSNLEDLISRYGSSCKTLEQAFRTEIMRIGQRRASVEGSTASVTLVKDNIIRYTLILNLLTGDVVLGYREGVFRGNVSTSSGIEDLRDRLIFREENSLSMLCYTKKGAYEQNRMGTRLSLFNLVKGFPSPGGPNRFLYLTDEQKEHGIGIIAHNGEKIQESLPNVAIAFFSKGALRAYKLTCTPDSRAYRGDKPLTPSLAQSMYNQDLIERVGITLNFLNNHAYPSEFRDTTVVVPSANEQAITMLTGLEQRGFAVRIV